MMMMMHVEWMGSKASGLQFLDTASLEFESYASYHYTTLSLHYTEAGAAARGLR